MRNIKAIWIVGNLILFYIQAVAQWTVQHHEGYSRFNQIKFRDEQTGFLVGDDSLVLKTSNGGADWTVIEVQEQIFFQDFQFIDDTTLIASGFHYDDAGNNDQSKVLISVDDGVSWEVMSSIPEKHFYTQWFHNLDTGLVAGFQGILRTEDQGDSWEPVWETASGSIEKLFFVNDTLGFAIGYEYPDNFLLKTENQGVDWNPVQSFDEELKSLYFLDDKIGFLGFNGGYYRTTDGGLQWGDQYMIPGHTPLSMDFISEEIGFMVSAEICPCIPEQIDYYASISKTLDGGASWDTFKIPGTLWSMDFLTENNGYISGDGNFTMHFDGGDLEELPEDYPWSIINDIPKPAQIGTFYPNPVTDRLVIEMNQPVGNCQLKAYSPEGKEILVKHRVENDAIKIDFTGLEKGMYLIKLIEKNQIQIYKAFKK